MNMPFCKKPLSHDQKLVFTMGAALGGGLLAMMPSPLAQAQPVEQVSRLEEVVVTARRREESLQEVPITINAFDEEFLRTHGVSDLDGLQMYTPAMAMTYNSGDTINPMITLRGVMRVEAKLVDDPSVPVYFSDVVMTPSAGLNLALFDVDSVQVLKGPQGTLFGRNSTAGAVLISPRLPDDELGGFVEGTVGNYGLFKTNFGVDVPLSDRFQVRLSGMTTERDGFQKNRNDLPEDRHNYGKRLWDDNTKAFRLSARWQVNDQLENVTSVEWGKKKARARASKAILTEIPSFQDSVDRNLELDDRYDVRVNIIAPENVEHTMASNITTWAGDKVTHKNILGYRKVRSFRQVDLDGMDASIIQSRRDGSGDSTKAEQFSNEYQMLGTAFDDRLDWVAGAYYYEMDGTEIINSASGGGRLEAADLKSTSYAVFAQGTYRFAEPWALTLGARQSWDEREIDLRKFGNVPANPTCALSAAGPECTLSDSAKFDSTDWLISLAYDINDSTMVYGSIGTGYKSGGYSSRANDAATLAPFDKEKVISYEAGIKSDWSAGDWQFRGNLSVYRMDIEDLQVLQAGCIDIGGGLCDIVSTTKNAAKATHQGLEAQLNIIPSDNLVINVGYAYVDPEYKEWPDIDSEGNAIDRTDTIFWFQPDHEANASIQYTIPTSARVGTISIMSSISWRDSMYLTFAPETVRNPAWRKAATQDAYHIVDFRVDWKDVLSSNFDLSFFVNNLQNKKYVVSASDQLKENRGMFFSHIYGEPRTYGATVRYSF